MESDKEQAARQLQEALLITEARFDLINMCVRNKDYERARQATLHLQLKVQDILDYLSKLKT